MTDIELLEIKNSPAHSATHKDLGLCWVDEVVVDSRVIRVCTPQTNPPGFDIIGERLKRVREELIKCGYLWKESI